MDEINRFPHPFKDEMAARLAGGTPTHGFDRTYFDDPDALTGFRGYSEEGNSAEGKRDFRQEALDVIAALTDGGERPLRPLEDGIRGVLDVGCAKGFLVRHLRKLGVDAWGTDISEYAISTAPADVRPYLRVATVQQIGPEQRYEVVHVCGVLIYLKVSEIRAALTMFRRIATRGLVLYEPTREMLERWLDARDEGAFDPMRLQELPAATWDELIREAGFERDPRGWWAVAG